MRRGALHDAALETGSHKVALGHHQDDALETFMLSLIYEGRINCFSPVTYLDRSDMTVIRPLLFTPEAEVTHFCRKSEIVPVPKNCPADGNTEREEMKKLLASIEKTNKGLRYRIFGAVQRGEVDGFHPALHLPKQKSTPIDRMKKGEETYEDNE